MLAEDKHSSLFVLRISDEEIKAYNIDSWLLEKIPQEQSVKKLDPIIALLS